MSGLYGLAAKISVRIIYTDKGGYNVVRGCVLLFSVSQPVGADK